MPGQLASPHWLLLMGLTEGGQSTPGSSFNHSVNKYLLSTHCVSGPVLGIQQ